MRFVREKESRRFIISAALFGALLFAVLTVQAFLQSQEIRSLLLEREHSWASSLLKEGVERTTVARALAGEEVTEEGERLMEQIGHSEETLFWLMPGLREEAAIILRRSAIAGICLAALALGGCCLFLWKREKIYQRALFGIEAFTKGDFGKRLPRGESGTLYQMFAATEQLALALKVKGESERKGRKFLEETISDISHQLKTPLAALHLYAEIIEGEPDNVEAVKEFSQKSLRSLERIEHLIQMLLKMARLDTGNIVFEKTSCKVKELLVDAVGELKIRARMEKKAILFQGDPMESVQCDPEWTKEAVANLVKNALDHMDGGGKVEIFWYRSPAMFRIAVKDNGEGIAPEDIHHIFKRFYRSKTAKKREGIGLGLPLAKAIVEGQGGSLSVKSEPGAGTEFTLSFLTQS